jgi:DNA processing protein
MEINSFTIRDKDYPTNLRYIYDPPKNLYVKGNILAEDSIAIAVIGSRQATYYGLKNAQDLSFELAARGITIVSGLARGVDSAAHRGALRAGGRTIAVLGSGLNVIYPYENKELAERIAKNGAVISEFSLDFPPYRHNFPRRNRIISGLSLGVVVVEAAKRSGALITARLALEQGREVFAIPGRIGSFSSQGTHSLIKQGAKLVESIEDIIEELEPLRTMQNLPEQEQIAQVRSASKLQRGLNLSQEERQIYSCLSSEPIHIDDIMSKAAVSYGKLLISLLKLEHKKLVNELPGKMFVKT